jgi:hypothetical protein
MGTKTAFSLIFILFALLALAVYWFIPLSTTEFFSQKTSNFSVEGVDDGTLQFYENMRFPDSRISYKITNCPLQKEDDMLRSLSSISQKTILSFYKVSSNEEISITCDSKTKVEGGLFIAGEGGPTNITRAGEFNVITQGKILLLKESSCPEPNIGIHELLHVLGFDHVSDPNNIMYPVSNCDQEISSETIDLINELYSIPSYPDLLFENVNAVMHGKYLNVNMSIRNNGFDKTGPSSVDIYTDDKLVKQVDVDPLEIGHGRIISLTNVWVSRLDVNIIRLEIVYTADELKKENNKIVLEIKK